MAEKWDKQFVEFLKRTGEDLKRTGEEIRKEAQRVMEDVRDPETQAKVKESLSNFGTWAKKTAEDAAGMIENAVKRAEEKVRGGSGAKPEATTPRAEGRTSSPSTTARSAATKPPRAATKTVGRKKAGGSRKPGVGTARPKKTVGRKK